MSTFLSRQRVLRLALGLSSLSMVAQAGSFNAVVVYGDSLSDKGNLFAATGEPGAPYYQGRRSDGPVAVEQLATALCTPLMNIALIGKITEIGNYADGGTPAALGAFSLPCMKGECAATQALLGPF